MAVDFTLHEDLMDALSVDQPDPARVQALLDQVRRTGIPLDTVTLEFAFRRTVERAAARFKEDPFDIVRIHRFERVVSLCTSLPFSTNLWAPQNVYNEARELLQNRQADGMTLHELDVLQTGYDTLGERLGFRIAPVVVSAQTNER
jgi:hypothetical protein